MSLTIVCPNAKRVQVKTTPLLLLRQVLEEACKKSGFDVNTHGLQTQNKKPIDLSLPFRLSGISNNATLEMIQKAATSQNSVVELAIQTTSGRRLKAVRVDAPLLDVLAEFSAEFGEDLTASSGNTMPCMVYMNKKYTGHVELSSNSLSTLGVTSGKCLIRYERVQLSDEALRVMQQNHEQEMEAKRQMDAKFQELKRQNDERERMEKLREEEFEKEREEREKREEEQRKAILPTEEDHMDTSDFQPPPPIQRDVLRDLPQQAEGAWSFDGNAFARPAQSNTMRMDELNALLERVDNSLSARGATNDRMNAMMNALADGGRISMAEVRARADAAVKVVEEEEKPEVFEDPVERHPILFVRGQKKVADEAMDLSEEFFEVQIEDIRNMQRDLKKTVKEQTQAGFVSKTFVAKKNRELKMKAYKHCVIRINIGLYTLQAFFKSGEPSSRLDEFVKSVFQNGLKVGLTCTNQKVETSDSKNFVDVSLAPTSTLVAKFGTSEVHAPNILAGIPQGTQEQADEMSRQWLKGNTKFEAYSSVMADDRGMKRGSVNHAEVSPSSRGPPAKVAMPKWMQGGKKF